jgi:magnesium transporter
MLEEETGERCDFGGYVIKAYIEDSRGIRETTALEGTALDECRLLWVDSTAPSKDELQELADFFGLHPLSIHAYEEADEIPKMTEFPNHLFVVWHFLRDDPETETVEYAPVFLFLGTNYLLTLHRAELEEITSIAVKMESDPELYRHQPAALLYGILDTAVDGYFPVAEDVTNHIDAFQEDVVSSGTSGDIHELMTLKHRNMALRRAASAHRDVILKLSRRDVRFIPEELSLYLLDVYDHLVRIGSEVDNNSDLITSSLDIHLSLVSNRLNEVMKKLTIVATIFLPLTFLAGVWGMNFRHMPELFWRHGYILAWVSLIVVGIITYYIAMRITSDKPRKKGGGGL